jgi:hypothetical protein
MTVKKSRPSSVGAVIILKTQSFFNLYALMQRTNVMSSQKINNSSTKINNLTEMFTGMYPKVSGLAARSENCKLYSSIPLSAVLSLFCESV